MLITGGLWICLTLLSWYWLRREFVELVTENILKPFYRVRGTGPGIAAFPTHGPVVVIANHAAYLDPLFLAIVLPRPVTPMMTASFFDKPFIRQLMLYVFDTIRVTETPVKREAPPELLEAIEALDHGKNLTIFPEGYLRRKDEVPVRRFGRGIWEILKAHPETPVVACWIEGSWGSYFSFKDGPPGKNKSRDIRRPIDIGVSAPVVLPPEILADHLVTRLHLMNLVIAARQHLGLLELGVERVPETQKEEKEV